MPTRKPPAADADDDTQEVIQAIRRIMSHEAAGQGTGENNNPDTPMLPENAAHRVEAAFRRLVGDKNSPPTILEALILEVLEPYLKNWMETTLPEVVERIVREEARELIDKRR